MFLHTSLSLARPFDATWPSVQAMLERPTRTVATFANVSDEVLMARYRDGDTSAFRALYLRYRDKLHRYALRLSGRSTEAEEVFQETWLAVIHSSARFDPSASFATWLFTLAHRRAADRWRALERHAPDDRAADAIDETTTSLLHDAVPTPEHRWRNDALGQALLAAVAALPLPQREAFLLKAEAELSLDAIAQVTGSNRETVKSRLRYAQQKLREALAPWR